MDHPFKPSEADPNRCGVKLPSCAPWPAPPTQTCWGLPSQHPDPAEEATS
jgi:hypothetical protein